MLAALHHTYYTIYTTLISTTDDPSRKQLLALMLSQLRIYKDAMLLGHLITISRCEIGILVHKRS